MGIFWPGHCQPDVMKPHPQFRTNFRFDCCLFHCEYKRNLKLPFEKSTFNSSHIVFRRTDLNFFFFSFFLNAKKLLTKYPKLTKIHKRQNNYGGRIIDRAFARIFHCLINILNIIFSTDHLKYSILFSFSNGIWLAKLDLPLYKSL